MSEMLELQQDTPATDAYFVDAAADIAGRLARTAYWDAERRRCNWIGRTDDEGADFTNPCTTALGAHLYAGTLGIALFLCELLNLRKDLDPSIARTARGALTRSLEQLLHRDDLPVSPLSFWAGDLGAIWVAKRFAETGLDPAAAAAIPELWKRVSQASEKEHLLDVIGGNAGAIPMLLLLARDEAWRDEALAIARRLGDEICDKARAQDGVAVWESPSASGIQFNAPPLTGVSHGTAGFALALLELAHVTGEPRYREYGAAAFAYEDALFNPAVGNWPDVRWSNSTGMSYQLAWCHGAGGIGLARARATVTDPERAETHEAMARTGIGTSMAHVESSLASRVDLSLCHGLGGLIEATLCAAELLDDDLCRAFARRAAADIIARWGGSDAYPSGAPHQAPNPTLLIGEAGIGYLFLRIAAGVQPLLAIY